MKVTTEVEIEVVAKATLRDGAVKVSVAASAPYGALGRTATASVETFDPLLIANVQTALQAIVDSALPGAVAKAQAEAQAAYKRALELKEEN